jgi:hypothetical protein
MYTKEHNNAQEVGGASSFGADAFGSLSSTLCPLWAKSSATALQVANNKCIRLHTIN